ncbi:MAG: hypothetical protein NXI22_08830, partial [bacterium]|nr:hypothetical protein [bacterium]
MLAGIQMAEAQTFRRIELNRIDATRVIRPPRRTTPPSTASSNFENDTVYRAQLRVKTANVKNAGTDDPVMARLGSVPGTWLDVATDDRERGRTNLYDIGLFNVGNRGVAIRDIRSLTISKTGSDGWNIESLEL